MIEFEMHSSISDICLLSFFPSSGSILQLCVCVCVCAQLHLALYGCKFLEDLIKAGENFLFRLHILK